MFFAITKASAATTWHITSGFKNYNYTPFLLDIAQSFVTLTQIAQCRKDFCNKFPLYLRPNWLGKGIHIIFLKHKIPKSFPHIRNIRDCKVRSKSCHHCHPFQRIFQYLRIPYIAVWIYNTFTRSSNILVQRNYIGLEPFLQLLGIQSPIRNHTWGSNVIISSKAVWNTRD